VTSLRAVFYEEDDARTVATRLIHEGFDAVVERERLAGEDDDEDHPWAVVTDAPELVVEVLVEERDGWLDRDPPGAAGEPTDTVDVPRAPLDVPPAPLDLPDAPRRVKGHFPRH